jgi:phosphonate transport system substrate-binding protein
MAFVPSTEAEKIVEGAEALMRMLEDETGYKFKDYVATSYIAVVEALGKEHVHVAWLPTLAYVLAHERNGAEVVLKVARHGRDTYYGLIITRVDSGIDELTDLKGKTFAFVEAASASGHLYPRALLMKNGVDPDADLERYIFAGGHDSAALAVYKGNVAAGAIYEDAREKFSETIPQVLAQTKIIGKTDPIPSDTVTIAADVPSAVADAITQALLDLVHSEEGRQAMYDIYNIEDLVPASDSDYDSVREMSGVLDLDLEKQVRRE